MALTGQVRISILLVSWRRGTLLVNERRPFLARASNLPNGSVKSGFPSSITDKNVISGPRRPVTLGKTKKIGILTPRKPECRGRVVAFQLEELLRFMRQ